MNGTARPSRRTAIPMLCVGLAVACASGCGLRPVLVTEADPVRMGPGVRARLYVRINGTWTLTEGRTVVPEGWYLVPPSYVEGK